MKLIACLSMLIDHIGFRSSTLLPLRGPVGRISFPIFAFTVSEGARHTRRPLRYILRLSIFALVTEPVFDLYFFGKMSLDGQNVMFTFALAVTAIISVRGIGARTPARAIASLCVVLLSIAASELLSCDYGAWGVVLVLLYAARKLFPLMWQRRLWVAAATLIFAARDVLTYFLRLPFGGVISPPSEWALLQLYAVLSLPFLLFYNGKRASRTQDKVASAISKYAFYIFYPLHLLLLYLSFT